MVLSHPIAIGLEFAAPSRSYGEARPTESQSDLINSFSAVLCVFSAVLCGHLF